MAKQQTFSDKAKNKNKAAGVNVKFIKAVKTGNSYKFNEKFVRIDDINKVTELK
jgi:hypothetical protein